MTRASSASSASGIPSRSGTPSRNAARLRPRPSPRVRHRGRASRTRARRRGALRREHRVLRHLEPRGDVERERLGRDQQRARVVARRHRVAVVAPHVLAADRVPEAHVRQVGLEQRVLVGIPAVVEREPRRDEDVAGAEAEVHGRGDVDPVPARTSRRIRSAVASRRRARRPRAGRRGRRAGTGSARRSTRSPSSPRCAARAPARRGRSGRSACSRTRAGGRCGPARPWRPGSGTDGDSTRRPSRRPMLVTPRTWAIRHVGSSLLARLRRLRSNPGSCVAGR